MTVSYVRSHSTTGSERLRPVLRQLQEPDHPVERERPQPDRRAQPVDRPRHPRPAGAVGAVAALRMAHGLSVVGGRTSSRTSSASATDRAGCRPSRRSTSRSRGRGTSGSTASRQASRSTTPSTPATSATCRPTSRRPTTAGSTIRSSARSDSSWARRAREPSSRGVKSGVPPVRDANEPDVISEAEPSRRGAHRHGGHAGHRRDCRYP